MANLSASSNINGSGNLIADAQIVRGQQSWSFIRWALALVLGIEAVFIGMIAMPWKIAAYFIALAMTLWLFDKNRVHEALLKVRDTIESKPRS
jgi:hypothetical protein